MHKKLLQNPGSFTPLGHWQYLLDKICYGSTDLLEAMVKRKMAVFKTKQNAFRNTANYITD
jgi:hypothetical protein